MPSDAQPGVGFVLPPGATSSAKNLKVPGSPIDQSADPWGFLGDPYGVPRPEQQAEWRRLVCQRYGEPKEGENVLPLPGTALHSTDFEAALTAIAQLDPGWFSRNGYGPGPAGRNGRPTQLEIHDAQYAKMISRDVIQHARELQTQGGQTGPSPRPDGTSTTPGGAPGVGFMPPQGTRSNARNLQAPLQPFDLTADPWSILRDPHYGVPTKQQREEWIRLVCQRYGAPRDGDILPEPGTAFHSTDFEAALIAIAQLDPGWFQRSGCGSGPEGRNSRPTQLEIHDAQYAQDLSQQIIDHARDLQLAQPGR